MRDRLAEASRGRRADDVSLPPQMAGDRLTEVGITVAQGRLLVQNFAELVWERLTRSLARVAARPD